MTGLSEVVEYFPRAAARRGLAVVLGQCDAHGPFEALVPAGRRPVCPRCTEEKERLQEVERRRAGMLRQAGVPGRFSVATFSQLERVCDEQAAVIANFKRWVAGVGRGEVYSNAVLLGRTGTGKTHMSCAAVLALIRGCGIRARYVTSEQVKREVCESWGGGGESESRVLERYGAYPVLVLDEVDILDERGPGLRVLNSVIDKRSGEQRPTVFISNQDQASLQELLGRRAVSRMFENALIMHCPWDDYRARKA
ncbi:ATP-binding protein [Chromobacterium haemolyticum]|uniref:ATP-binding protein n=1 Tax=Chromobacterium haemolyticum TaxID=394935 RepID=UPI001746E880|nr:ATP-binding protein [Chromobacterium haemolyticum]QOD84168.1 ATP-binding protein [Chromobacterium haemolyticum]